MWIHFRGGLLMNNFLKCTKEEIFVFFWIMGNGLLLHVLTVHFRSTTCQKEFISSTSMLSGGILTR